MSILLCRSHLHTPAWTYWPGMSICTIDQVSVRGVLVKYLQYAQEEIKLKILIWYSHLKKKKKKKLYSRKFCISNRFPAERIVRKIQIFFLWCRKWTKHPEPVCSLLGQRSNSRISSQVSNLVQKTNQKKLDYLNWVKVCIFTVSTFVIISAMYWVYASYTITSYTRWCVQGKKHRHFFSFMYTCWINNKNVSGSLPYSL